MSNKEENAVEFDGIELGEKPREAITVMVEELDHVFDPVKNIKGVDAGYLIDECHTINWRSEVSDVRDLLNDAGLVKVVREEKPDPLRDKKVMIPTQAAFEHADYLEWRPEMTLEDRVERLERLVDEGAVVDPSGFDFGE